MIYYSVSEKGYNTGMCLFAYAFINAITTLSENSAALGTTSTNACLKYFIPKSLKSQVLIIRLNKTYIFSFSLILISYLKHNNDKEIGFSKLSPKCSAISFKASKYNHSLSFIIISPNS